MKMKKLKKILCIAVPVLLAAVLYFTRPAVRLRMFALMHQHRDFPYSFSLDGWFGGCEAAKETDGKTGIRLIFEIQDTDTALAETLRFRSELEAYLHAHDSYQNCRISCEFRTDSAPCRILYRSMDAYDSLAYGEITGTPGTLSSLGSASPFSSLTLTDLDAEDLSPLDSQTALSELNLIHCVHVTDAELDRLRGVLPDCRISSKR